MTIDDAGVFIVYFLVIPWLHVGYIFIWTDAALLFFFNAGLQNWVLGVPVRQKTVFICNPQRSIRIFRTLRIKFSLQVDIAVVPVANCIGGRGLWTDTCSLSVARSHICSVCIVLTGPSGTGTFSSTWNYIIYNKLHEAFGSLYLQPQVHWS